MNEDKTFITKLETIQCFSHELKSDSELKPRLHLEIFHNGKRLYVIEASIASAFVADSEAVRIATISRKELNHEH